MIYRFQCPECQMIYDIYQKMKDKHDFTCPQCEKSCKRVFTLAHIKKNEGFYSHTLGEYVNSHTDFCNKLNACRIENDNDKYVDSDFADKDKYIEKREKKYEQQRKEASIQREMNEEALGK